jgi:HEAT repeat protein
MMKRRPLFTGIALAVLLVAGFAGFVLLDRRQYLRESYQGKHTLEWSLQLLNTTAIGSESNRAEAVMALHALGPKAVPPLRRMLAERDGFYDRTVVTATRWLPRNQRWTLLSQLRPGQALLHRLAALAGLAVLGTNAASAVHDLGRALQEPVGQIRWDAARALAAIGEAAIPTLITAATGTNPVARHAAVYALAQSATNSPRAKAALLNAVLDSDENVRLAAIHSVRQLGLDAVPMLNEQLASKDLAQQLAALRALAVLRPLSRAETTNLLTLAINSTGEVRRQAIETMSALRIASTNAAGIMITALDDPDPEVRLAAIRAVAEINWRTAVAIPRLEEFTRSTNPRERKRSAWALAQFGSRASNTVSSITVLLDDSDLEVRKAATNALAEINPPAN